jgi:hypothetical protein
MLKPDLLNTRRNTGNPSARRAEQPHAIEMADAIRSMGFRSKFDQRNVATRFREVR